MKKENIIELLGKPDFDSYNIDKTSDYHYMVYLLKDAENKYSFCFSILLQFDYDNNGNVSRYFLRCD